MTSRILLFAEDPGAGNVVGRLSDSLGRLGYDAVLCVADGARRRAEELGLAYTAVSADACAIDMVAAAEPALVVTGTSDRIDTPGLALIAAARDRGIPSLGIVDGQAAYAHRFRGTGNTPTAFPPTWLAVPDAITAANYASVGFDPDRIAVVGNLHHEWVVASRSSYHDKPRELLRSELFPGIGERKVIVFGTEISKSRGHADHSYDAKDSFHGYSGTRLRTHILLEETLAALDRLSVRHYRVLRLHPKTPIGEFERFRPAFDLVSERGDSLALVYAADLVIGLTSILLEEAALLGTPSLALIRRDEEMAWLTAVRDGWIDVVRRRADLPGAIETALSYGREIVLARADRGVATGNSCQSLVALTRHLIEAKVSP